MLKSTEEFTRLWPSLVVAISYATAFYFLTLALRAIPVGVAYAVWSGIGVVLITVGGVARVSSQPPIALARAAIGLVGYSLECTHAGTTVDIRSNFTLKCPNHGAEFSFDGSWTGGEQQTSSLFRVTVTPDATGATVSLST